MDYIKNFYAGYRDLMDNKSDPRTSEWFLMSSPWPTAAICITYAICVKVFLALSIKNFKLIKLLSGYRTKAHGKQKTF